MPIKLTSADYKIIAFAAAVSALALGVSVRYFGRAFPEAAIEFRVNRSDSEPLARKFLADRGARLEGYRHAAVFRFDDETKVYLERSQGLERMNQLTRGPLRLWRWSHRWFKPQQKEEFRVDVTPAGEAAGFDHEIPESAPGANLDAAAARGLAERFLREVMKRDLTGLEFLETRTEKRPARTDHAFTWKQKSMDLGEGSLRLDVGVDGDQVAGYREFVKIPEQWSRDYEKLRSRNEAAQVVAEVFFILLSVAMVIILVQRLRDRDVPARLALAFGGVAAVLYFLAQLNDFSVAEFGYRTTDSYSSFLAGYIQRSVMSAMGLGTWIFFLVASAEPVYRAGYPGLISLRRTLSWPGLRTRSFFMANVVGIALVFFFFAYQTVFYLFANKLGAWAPSDINYSDLLNTRVPWVWVLFFGFLPAVSEEMQFRAFAIPFLKKLLRSGPAALVLAAFMWGFLHSAYPNQPFFIRGVEVGVGGIVTGLIMLRFGILATLVWHYSVDAIYTAFLLLRSHNTYLMVSGAVTAGFMLIPLVAAFLAYLRAGTFTEETTLTNASEGISRPPRPEAAAEPVAALAYQPLDSRRVMLAGLLVAVCIGLARIPVHRFGEGIKLRTTRMDAIRLADDFLKAQQVNVSNFRRVAWLRENVDTLALRYLLERKSIAESDRIYRQATRPVLWEVRYFRPLEKEERLVFIDPSEGRVFGTVRVLDENAPGASLSAEEARRMAEKYVAQQGYRLADFTLQDSQSVKRKAREDYTLTWQAKPGDPRNVADAHYRLEVDIAGDQVVGFRRYFKLPEQWERGRRATPLANRILSGLWYMFILGLVSEGLVLFVQQVRRGQIPWRPAAKVGAALAAALALVELAAFTVIDRQYPTSIPLNIYRIREGVSFLVLPLLAGLGAWLVVGFATSLYPDAWRVLRSDTRRRWRRDAAIGIVVTLAAGAGLSRMAALFANRYHAFAPVKIDLFPYALDTFTPGAGIFLGALLWSVLYAALVGLAIYAFRLGVRTRAWWLWLGGALLLISLGPAGAHSGPEFLAGWAMNFVAFIVPVGIIALFFRDNVLAYIGAAFCVRVADPLRLLLSQQAPYYLWNGLLLAGLSLIVLGWMLLAGKDTASA